VRSLVEQNNTRRHLFSDRSCVSEPLPSGLLGQASRDDGRDAVVTLELPVRNLAGPGVDLGTKFSDIFLKS
jgi:hypothetical protein